MRKFRMVWGAFCGTLYSRLVLILSKAKVTCSLSVRTIVYPPLVPFWHECCKRYEWVTVVGGGALSYKGWVNWYQNVNEMETM